MARLITGDIRAHIVPAQDLDLQGDTGEPLRLLSDVEVELAVLALLNPIRPRAAQASNNGGLLVTPVLDVSPILGSEGNVWNNVLTGVNTIGAVVDTLDATGCTLMVRVNAACTITFDFSADGVNFYQAFNHVFAGAGSFATSLVIGARFVTMESSANVTATGTVQMKP